MVSKITDKILPREEELQSRLQIPIYPLSVVATPM
jgi:hypothetical protein